MCITCDYDNFLQIYGITQVPEKNEYMLVMQYAEGGNLLTYLVQNINKLTWRMKAELVKFIAFNLEVIHSRGLIHCDLQGGNVLLDKSSASMSSSTSFTVILASLNQCIHIGQTPKQFKEFCHILHQKFFILTNIPRNQIYMVLVFLCIRLPVVSHHSEIGNLTIS